MCPCRRSCLWMRKTGSPGLPVTRDTADGRTGILLKACRGVVRAGGLFPAFLLSATRMAVGRSAAPCPVFFVRASAHGKRHHCRACGRTWREAVRLRSFWSFCTRAASRVRNGGIFPHGLRAGDLFPGSGHAGGLAVASAAAGFAMNPLPPAGRALQHTAEHYRFPLRLPATEGAAERG